jgi:hypothetical protein
LGNQLPKHLKCFVRLLEHSLCRTAVIECHSHFKAGQVSVEDDELSGRRSTSKTTENVEKYDNSSTKTVTE